MLVKKKEREKTNKQTLKYFREDDKNSLWLDYINRILSSIFICTCRQ